MTTDIRPSLRLPRLGSLALEILSRRVLGLAVTVPGPNRLRLSLSDATTGELQARRPMRLLRRLAADGAIGFGEAYMDGDWDTPDLSQLIEVLARRPVIRGFAARRLLHRLEHLRRANTRTGSRRNIAAHYDLGNDFFRLWLDPSMTYSSGLFADPGETLAAAQDRKYRNLARMLDLRPGMRVLEIGCGWGGFAEIAARDFGCHVTCLTLSQEQHDYARARIAQAGLADRVEIRLQDYRDVQGRFDRIASIEMFEAVGEANWPTYFGVLRDRLAPGGAAGLQVITIADDRYDRYRRRPDFIQRHIFPGGMLPSPSAFATQASMAGLRIDREQRFGASYARTLADWHRAFDQAWPRIAEQGFDDRFRRMWKFYLAYCEGGFRAGAIDVAQYRLSPAASAS